MPLSFAMFCLTYVAVVSAFAVTGATGAAYTAFAVGAGGLAMAHRVLQRAAHADPSHMRPVGRTRRADELMPVHPDVLRDSRGAGRAAMSAGLGRKRGTIVIGAAHECPSDPSGS